MQITDIMDYEALKNKDISSHNHNTIIIPIKMNTQSIFIFPQLCQEWICVVGLLASKLFK